MEQNPKTTKEYVPIKLKQLSVIFILNHINNSFHHTKIGMTLLVHTKI